MFVADEQAEVAVDVARWERLAADVLAAEGVEGDVEVSLLFVDEAHIADLNRRFLGQRGPTDVLSFPLDGEDLAPGRDPDGGTAGPHRELAPLDDEPLLLGDVVICPVVARRNAPDHAGDVDDELALLVVHGILHLLGMDHAEPDERAAMQAAERRLLAGCWRPLAADPWAAVNAGTSSAAGSGGATPTLPGDLGAGPSPGRHPSGGGSS